VEKLMKEVGWEVPICERQKLATEK
jgi:hypothetical protein